MNKKGIENAMREEVKKMRTKLGAMLKDLRLNKEMKQKNLAKRIKCTAAHISQVENGRSGVSIRVLNQILDVFKIKDRSEYLSLL